MSRLGDHLRWSTRGDDVQRFFRTRRRGVGVGVLVWLQNKELQYQVVRVVQCRLADHPKEAAMMIRCQLGDRCRRTLSSL